MPAYALSLAVPRRYTLALAILVAFALVVTLTIASGVTPLHASTLVGFFADGCHPPVEGLRLV